MADLDAASVDDVKQFFKIYYAPNNAVLVLVGDLDTKETLAKVKKYFGGIPRQEAAKPADLTEAPKTAERRAALADPLARLTRIDIAYRIPASGDPDARALGIAASILGGGGGGGGRGGASIASWWRKRKLRPRFPAPPTGAPVPACSTSLRRCVRVRRRKKRRV
jgi:predicted Zn-dependent peptidase